MRGRFRSRWGDVLLHWLAILLELSGALFGLTYGSIGSLRGLDVRPAGGTVMVTLKDYNEAES